MRFIDGEEKKRPLHYLFTVQKMSKFERNKTIKDTKYNTKKRRNLAKIRKDGIRRAFFPLIKNSQNVYPYFGCGNKGKVLQ